MKERVERIKEKIRVINELLYNLHEQFLTDENGEYIKDENGFYVSEYIDDIVNETLLSKAESLLK